MHRLPYLVSLRFGFAPLLRSRTQGVLCRTYSTVLPSNQSKTVRVPVGGGGHVELDIRPPVYSAAASSAQILVCLPTSNLTFLHQTTTTLQDANDASFISSQLPSATIVTLKYRLKPLPSPLVYPVAIHDVATAFDYISSSLVTPGLSKPKICLFGHQIGGALATMLALTQPNDIHALAVSEPLVDWVSLDDYTAKQAHSEIPKSKKSPISEAEVTAAKILIGLRLKLFRTPGSFFDPFASPTLFLRAPGRDVPLSNDIHDSPNMPDALPLEAFGPYDDDISIESASLRLQRSSSVDTGLDTDDSSPSTTRPKRRKVLQRWPISGRPESVMLPHTRISVQRSNSPSTVDEGVQSILYAQGIELGELMRRACFIGREKIFAESRVNVVGLQTKENGSGTAGLEEAAAWLREKFEDD